MVSTRTVLPRANVRGSGGQSLLLVLPGLSRPSAGSVLTCPNGCRGAAVRDSHLYLFSDLRKKARCITTSLSSSTTWATASPWWPSW